MSNYRIIKRNGLYEIQMLVRAKLIAEAIKANQSVYCVPLGEPWETVSPNHRTFEEAEQEMKRMEPDSFEVIKEYNI